LAFTAPETVKLCSAETDVEQKALSVPEVERVGVITVAVTAVLLDEIHPVIVFLVSA
jgi:hypothetical protein